MKKRKTISTKEFKCFYCGKKMHQVKDSKTKTKQGYNAECRTEQLATALYIAREEITRIKNCTKDSADYKAYQTCIAK